MTVRQVEWNQSGSEVERGLLVSLWRVADRVSEGLNGLEALDSDNGSVFIHDTAVALTCCAYLKIRALDRGMMKRNEHVNDNHA